MRKSTASQSRFYIAYLNPTLKSSKTSILQIKIITYTVVHPTTTINPLEIIINMYNHNIIVLKEN